MYDDPLYESPIRATRFRSAHQHPPNSLSRFATVRPFKPHENPADKVFGDAQEHRLKQLRQMHPLALAARQQHQQLEQHSHHHHHHPMYPPTNRPIVYGVEILDEDDSDTSQTITIGGGSPTEVAAFPFHPLSPHVSSPSSHPHHQHHPSNAFHGGGGDGGEGLTILDDHVSPTRDAGDGGVLVSPPDRLHQMLSHGPAHDDTTNGGGALQRYNSHTSVASPLSPHRSYSQQPFGVGGGGGGGGGGNNKLETIRTNDMIKNKRFSPQNVYHFSTPGR